MPPAARRVFLYCNPRRAGAARRLEAGMTSDAPAPPYGPDHPLRLAVISDYI